MLIILKFTQIVVIKYSRVTKFQNLELLFTAAFIVNQKLFDYVDIKLQMIVIVPCGQSLYL